MTFLQHEGRENVEHGGDCLGLNTKRKLIKLSQTRFVERHAFGSLAILQGTAHSYSFCLGNNDSKAVAQML